MTSPLEGSTFLFMWIGFTLLMTGGIGLLFLWAIRAGQFSDQDRARYLALQCGIPNDVPPPGLPPLEGGADTCQGAEKGAQEEGQHCGRWES